MESKRRDKGLFKSESSTKSTDYPGMWRVPRNSERCCIYRVPNSIRSVNPEAYTPQLLIIGPLHHSLKSEALKSRGDITNTKSMGYLNMETHKKFYLSEFAQRFDDGEETIDGFRRIIEENEKAIRESYSESTTWIESSEFVEMILHDSVFIIELILKLQSSEWITNSGDPLMKELCLETKVSEDLILLENQLPYFILEKLFAPVIPSLSPYQSLHHLIIKHFDFDGKIRNDSEFKHFTDLVRCTRVETLQERVPTYFKGIKHMYNMEQLNSGGVKFEVVEKEFPYYVRFEKGCLKIPLLRIYDNFEMELRNIMALEQCHYALSAHICNYFIFLDHLIDTDKDVDLLVKKGIIQNRIGEHRLVAEMVNKLCMGMAFVGSYHSDIAASVNEYYENPFNRSRAAFKNDLKSVYFSSLLKGTGTVAAMLLLIMTLIQTVASIIQVMQNTRSSK